MTPPTVTAATPIRIARPSADLRAAEAFYVDGVGLSVLWRSDADDFAELLMLGVPGALWHLELTRARHHDVRPTPTPEDLLVLYLDAPVPPALVERMVAHGGRRVTALNPYWERWGVTVADPDGYRLVLCQRSWTT
ncbi:catechol 2,3-dioxygenase-like lactoylglutathione lyase family enzyme [Deinococcus metalli]|uniref:Catechol 2,3-dioxygenase-like lactoylglutathione lyase family enzyme n=1 Tax=Deinococcus metalli TaxID=1141878 RepID=A0A7W8NPD2_9DEIO|nr:VOC family protein [Deinococcus metalli]MBB5374718.1 catechol 2,3-dioxygenase-like lactoylglutathione lyase family enzyme [Deinococcus metalli]GHF34225.1 glyoxalase/bleomycin resistance protein/dioxygenase [Deinococcus metalli]